MILQTSTTFYATEAKAAAIAAEMTAADTEGWTYVATFVPAAQARRFVIAIFDEDGAFVANY